MRKLTGLFAISSLVVGALAADALAQQAPAPGMRDRQDTQQQRQPRQERPAWQNRQGAVESRELVGMRVKTSDGRNVGEIAQLLVDPKNGQITHAVIGLGGFAGIGEQKVVVPWTEVKVQREQAAGQPGPGGAQPEAPGARARTEGRNLVAMVEQSVIDRAPRYAGTAGAEGEWPPAASPGVGDRERQQPERPAR